MTVQEFLNLPRGALVKFNQRQFKGCIILLDEPKPPEWQKIDKWRLTRYTKFSYGSGRFVDVTIEYWLEASHHKEEFRRARRLA